MNIKTPRNIRTFSGLFILVAILAGLLAGCRHQETRITFYIYESADTNTEIDVSVDRAWGTGDTANPVHVQFIRDVVDTKTCEVKQNTDYYYDIGTGTQVLTIPRPAAVDCGGRTIPWKVEVRIMCPGGYRVQGVWTVRMGQVWTVQLGGRVHDNATPPSDSSWLRQTGPFSEWRGFLTSNAEQSLAVLCTKRAQAAGAPEMLPVVAPTSTTTPTACQLLAPADGSALPAEGAVNFSWRPVTGANDYIIYFTSAGGAVNKYRSTEPTAVYYIETLAGAGTYTWEVTARDASEAELCTAGPFTFTKPISVAQPTQAPQEGCMVAEGGNFTCVAPCPDPNNYPEKCTKP